MIRKPLPHSTQCNIVIDGKELDYVLRISPRRRTIGFKVDTNGLTVSSPIWVRESDIKQALHQQSDWILSKLKTWADRAPSSSPLLFHDGDLVGWLGHQIPIRLVSSNDALPRQLSLTELQDLKALPIWEECSDRLAAITAWYVTHALPWFRFRTQHFADKLGYFPRGIKVSQAKGRWGSCNRHGLIRLNWRLMKASPEEIDYVIAHECAHLVHMNHSAAFWNTVSTLYPNWKTISKLLNLRDPSYRNF
jgi:predicted metal-dependent hydrolase